LQKEELKYYIDYERRTAGILKNKKKKKKLIRTGEIKTLVKYDKKYGNSIKKKKKKKKKEIVRNDFIELGVGHFAKLRFSGLHFTKLKTIK